MYVFRGAGGGGSIVKEIRGGGFNCEVGRGRWAYHGALMYSQQFGNPILGNITLPLYYTRKHLTVKINLYYFESSSKGSNYIKRKIVETALIEQRKAILLFPGLCNMVK